MCEEKKKKFCDGVGPLPPPQFGTLMTKFLFFIITQFFNFLEFNEYDIFLINDTCKYIAIVLNNPYTLKFRSILS